MRMTAWEIAAACGGRILCGDPETEVTSVSTDSRKIAPGALFVPIHGERTDAHAYIPATFAAGAAATLTQNHAAMDDSHVWIAVPDTVEALRRAAAAYRSRFHLPEGNQNSQVGLSLTMFQLAPEHEVAVVEMGMSDFGEMARLAQIARPQYAVMTNIGISHIQQLGTQENILAEKLHITDAFLPGSILFLNGDDPRLAALRDSLPQVRKVFFGAAPWCQYRAAQVRQEGEGVAFTALCPGESLPVVLPVPGEHNVRNALAALAVTRELGGSLPEAAAALARYQPLAMRQQIHRTSRGVTIIDDSYNASPDALYSSLQVLAGFPGRHVAVLADMMELGAMEEEAHREVGRRAARAGVDLLVTVGERARWMGEGAREVAPGLPRYGFQTNGEAAAFLDGELRPGDVVLVKGSRSMHTDEIVKALL